MIHKNHPVLPAEYIQDELASMHTPDPQLLVGNSLAKKATCPLRQKIPKDC
jgi:hypothetical protein